MARNWIQFQKGYRLTQFVDEFGTEEPCVAAVFSWRWTNGFVCPKCEHTQCWSLQSRAQYQCRGCRHQVSLTAGTILDSTKLPLRTWFLAMYLLTQTKNGISALELSRQLGLSHNIAWSLKHKLMQVMKESDDTRPMGGWVQLDDAYWGGDCRAEPGGARDELTVGSVARRAAGRRWCSALMRRRPSARRRAYCPGDSKHSARWAKRRHRTIGVGHGRRKYTS